MILWAVGFFRSLSNSLIALSENIVSLIGFEPGAKSSTLNSFTCLMSTPLIEPDSLAIFLFLRFLLAVVSLTSILLSFLLLSLSALLITIIALTAECACLPLRLAVPDRRFREKSSLFNSSFIPIARRTFRRSLVLDRSSIASETIIGKLEILDTLWPRLSIRSFLAVAAIAEHNANCFSLLLIFL